MHYYNPDNPDEKIWVPSPPRWKENTTESKELENLWEPNRSEEELREVLALMGG
jgi:hypothetical protein